MLEPFANVIWLSKLVKSKALCILILAVAFFVYQLYLLLNSFPATFRILNFYLSRIQTGELFWSSVWFSSEFIGEMGLIMRFAGACFFVAFTWVLFRKKELILSRLRKAVLLEGIHFLFYIPFISYLYTRPEVNAAIRVVYVETAVSYTIQTVLVFSSLIMLYFKMRRFNADAVQLFKLGAIGITSYVFALWVKHFMFCLYALPIDFADPVLLAGFLNSALMMFAAALILLFAFVPVIRGKRMEFSLKAVGIAFVLVGAYFVVYILVSLVNSHYLSFLTLTELWAVAFAVAGACLLARNND